MAFKGDTRARHDSVTPPQPGPCWEVIELWYPDHLECYECKKLHDLNDTLAHAQVKPWTKCGTDIQNLRMAKFIHPRFNSTIFRIIMKQSRQGKDVGDVMRLLSFYGEVVIKESQVLQKISEARIVDGSLLMRSQIRYVVPPSKAARKLLLNRNMFKCPHSRRDSLRDNVIATRRLLEKFEKLNEIGRREHIMEHQCKRCPTDFSIFLERFEGQGVVLFIVKWQDIGTGLAPFDADLQPLISPRPPSIRTPRRGEVIEYESPRIRFGAVTSIECLLAPPATLTPNEREGLFRVHDSWQARLFRCKESLLWPMFQHTHMFPHQLMIHNNECLGHCRHCECPENIEGSEVNL